MGEAINNYYDLFKALQDNYGYQLQDILSMSFEDFQLLIKLNSKKQEKENVATTIDQAFPFLF